MSWPWSKKRKKDKQAEQPTPADTYIEMVNDQQQELAANTPGKGSPELESLTPRERDVFDLLIKGTKLKDIAVELGVKFSTINTHQKKVYKKLGVNSRAECILRYGLQKSGEE